VAQIQAVSFSANSITVHAGADFKRILRAARLARLMHTITAPQPGCWQIELTGPASVLRETRRYGVNFARFLPALICCSDWTMEAIMESRGLRNLRLHLSSRDGLKSHLPPDDEFDSAVEAEFAAKWGEGDREGWLLRREAEIFHAGQKTFIPDFVMEHVTGRRVLLEIVGFWTPEYLEQRVRTLQLFRGVPIVLAIQEANAARIAQAVEGAGVIAFRKSLQVKSGAGGPAGLFGCECLTPGHWAVERLPLGEPIMGDPGGSGRAATRRERLWASSRMGGNPANESSYTHSVTTASGGHVSSCSRNLAPGCTAASTVSSIRVSSGTISQRDTFTRIRPSPVCRASSGDGPSFRRCTSWSSRRPARQHRRTD
jgi:hypothetical protein